MNAFRTIAICGALLFCLGTSTTEAQTWRKALSPTYPGITLNDIFFLDANHGWTVGSRGKVLFTADGGANGNEATIDTLMTLYSVFFRDASNGYAGAGSRTLCRTTDGGFTWSSAPVTEIPDAGAMIRSIYFADANRGWILATLSSTYGRILHTTDGGTSWTLDLTVAASNLIDMDFWSADTGVATGKSVGTLYYTTNGTTWTLAPTPGLGGFTYTRSDIRAVDMVSPTTAYATGWGSSAAGLQPSIHLKTTDGGATWTYLTQSAANRTYDNVYGIWFKDSLTGIAGGGGSVLVRTTDGGVNWVPTVFPSGATINAVSGAGDEIWVCGADGILYFSPDFGNTWELITEIPSASINALQWTSANVGYAAGFDAIFLKTTNHGENWQASFISANGVSQNVNDISFPSDDVGYAAHSYRMLTKTTDGGATWSSVIPDTNIATMTNYGVYFLDQSLGFAVGQLSSTNGVVYKTTDGGATWDTRSGVAAKSLRGVGFGDADHGVVTGAGRTVMFTTDGGGTWTAATLNNVPTNRANATIKKVRYLTATTAVAVGDSTVLRSTDAGATWEYIATASHTSLGGLDAENATTAYAVGTGEVWKTTDAGLSWTNITDPSIVTGTLYSVAVDKDGNPWIGSASSTLYTTAGTVGVNEGPPIAAEYRLDQNYPNPFNPTTTIAFQVAKTGNVRLAVYDILGREVALLLNERKNAGSYEVRFDASTLSTGLYLYRIAADGFVQAKKMLLVK
jgi:photosystem II stability/assembly factor-like uncharacterized protein